MATTIDSKSGDAMRLIKFIVFGAASMTHRPIIKTIQISVNSLWSGLPSRELPSPHPMGWAAMFRVPE